MRRFIVLTLLGGLATLAGQAVVSFGLHPERLAPVAVLLQGCATLVLGAALFGTGLLGLADGYEKMAGRVDELLRQKELSDARSSLPVTDHNCLHSMSQQFWRGYSRTGVGLSLFLAGLLVVTATLSHSSPTVFMIGVGSAIVILAVVAATVSVRGLRGLRSAHIGVDSSARQLSRLPDRRPAESLRPPRSRRSARVTLFPRPGSGGATRGLDARRASANQPRTVNSPS